MTCNHLSNVFNVCDLDQSESLAQCTQAISNSHTYFQMEKTLISGINLHLTHSDIFPLPEIDKAVSNLLIAWKKSVRLKSAALDPIQSQELEKNLWVFLDAWLFKRRNFTKSHCWDYHNTINKFEKNSVKAISNIKCK